MDGARPPGHKIGLIDEYHIWCFSMDLFNYKWCITFAIDGNMIPTFAKNMIAHFVPQMDQEGLNPSATIHFLSLR
jgi:hypothetical protein